MPESVEFRWPVGDVVTAVAQAGLRIIEVEEIFTPPNGQVPAEKVSLYSLFPNDYVLLASKS